MFSSQRAVFNIQRITSHACLKAKFQGVFCLC